MAAAIPPYTRGQKVMANWQNPADEGNFYLSTVTGCRYDSADPPESRWVVTGTPDDPGDWGEGGWGLRCDDSGTNNPGLRRV